MLKVSSGEDGYLNNWIHTCDSCQATACTLYCHTDSAYLCHDCDKRIHGDNTTALSHHRVWICDACEAAPAAVTCSADAASLCIECDIQVHSVNPLASRHTRVPIPPIAGQICSSSNVQQDDQLPGTMFDTKNEIAALTMELNLEIDEDETDSWLLLEPGNTDNQTMSGFTYGEQLDEYVDVVDTCTESFGPEQSSDQQQLVCVNCPEDSGSDSVVPVQTPRSKNQPLQEETQLQKQQFHSTYFNSEQSGSKAAFTNYPSSSLRGAQLLQANGIYHIHVPMPMIAPAGIPNSFTGFPTTTTTTTETFPNPWLLIPLQFTSMNREEKVLRYREKRKSRKFEKKIRYASRKAYAETRPRIKGKFARKTDKGIEDDQMFSKEDNGYGVVPSL
uniref:CONSTANS-like 2 protein n=4 Tax=Gossypium TaxID=3633 RepID=A0A0D3R1T9_GOSBA|nr:CONSTANS-like 2 protein [Gossypium barbadense]AJR28696.1 CONSTANS-like 2 protein [Gossypium barbadense var. peruvianum]AJR28700.1 CONSTANS-like 2 protein [Gossypium barbadense var. brasiliense]AJR28704.1 CONSTANS-like 2 protein [Gossypium mustelinum]